MTEIYCCELRVTGCALRGMIGLNTQSGLRHVTLNVAVNFVSSKDCKEQVRNSYGYS